MRKTFLLSVLSAIIVVALIVTAYVATIPRWQILVWFGYPLERWELDEKLIKEGGVGYVPNEQPIPENMRGTIETFSREWWRYRNDKLGFEMEFPARNNEKFIAGWLKQFEKFIDESPYNKQYSSMLGRGEQLLDMRVRRTRFHSLKKWERAQQSGIAHNKSLLINKEAQVQWGDPVGEEREWTTVSGYPAMIITEGYLPLPPGTSLTFMQRRRNLFIIHKGMLYNLDMMYIPEAEYRRVLESLKIF